MADVEESVREFEETLKECTRQLEEAKEARRGAKADQVGEPRQVGKHGAQGMRGRIFD